MKKRKQNNKYNSNINKVKNNYTVNVQDANSYVFSSVSLNAGNRTGKLPNLYTLMKNCFNSNEDLKNERISYLASYFDKKTKENKVFTSIKEEFEYINLNVFNMIKDFLLIYKTEIEFIEVDIEGDIRLILYYKDNNETKKRYYFLNKYYINDFFKDGIRNLFFINHIEDIDNKFLYYLEELISIDEKEELSDVLNSEDKTTKKMRL